MDRDMALDVKCSIDAAIEQLRAATRRVKGDVKLKESIREEIDRLLSIKKLITVPREPKKAKEKPYVGGGNWHGGRLPGGRMAPTPRSIRDEQW